MFGKRNRTPGEKPVSQANIATEIRMPVGNPVFGQAPAMVSAGPRFVDSSSPPWRSDTGSAAACNFALSNLANLLPQLVQSSDRVHHETYLAAAGAIAGFAAQRTLFHPIDPVTDPDLHVKRSWSGDRLWFGSILDEALANDIPDRSSCTLWPVVCRAAASMGLDVDGMPDVVAMFAHVDSTVGEHHEGRTSVHGNYQPHVSGRDLLKGVWPTARKCFSGRLDGHSRDYGAVPPKWWGAIAARACVRPVMEAKPVVPLDIALTILMETAIYTARLDPASAGEKF